MSATLRLAQLSDPHLGPLPPFWPSDWNLKRFAGYINYRRNRRGFDDRTTIDRLLADARHLRVDHTVVTGDLINLGMPREYVMAREWLQNVGPPDLVTAIPGNHDIYTPLRRDPGIARWIDYMRCDDEPASETPAFPFVRRLGQFALVGLNSAIVTPPGRPYGEVGQGQLVRFAELSRRLHGEGLMRIVLIHHPPLPEHSRERGLLDSETFERALLDVGAELVLHGHNHRDMISWRDTATGPVPIIGAGCAALGRYNVYDLIWNGPGAASHIEVQHRGLHPPDGRVVEISRARLDPDPKIRRRII